MFITTRNGYVNTALCQVVRCSNRKGDKGYEYTLHVTWNDGTADSFETNNYVSEWDLNEDPVVAAYPGFTLLVYYRDDDNPEWINRSPVIAWKIDTSTGDYHTPMSLDPPASNAIGSGVLCPDGQVVDIGSCGYKSEDDWLADMRERFADRQKAKKHEDNPGVSSEASSSESTKQSEPSGDESTKPIDRAVMDEPPIEAEQSIVHESAKFSE